MQDPPQFIFSNVPELLVQLGFATNVEIFQFPLVFPACSKTCPTNVKNFLVTVTQCNLETTRRGSDRFTYDSTAIRTCLSHRVASNTNLLCNQSDYTSYLTAHFNPNGATMRASFIHSKHVIVDDLLLSITLVIVVRNRCNNAWHFC